MEITGSSAASALRSRFATVTKSTRSRAVKRSARCHSFFATISAEVSTSISRPRTFSRRALCAVTGPAATKSISPSGRYSLRKPAPSA